MKFGNKTIHGWQKWFAWVPVQVYTGEWVWFEYVERHNWYGSEELDRSKYPLTYAGYKYIYREIETDP